MKTRLIATMTAVLVGLWLPMAAQAYVVSNDGMQLTTERGDTLWKISADLCGSGVKWDKFKSTSNIGIGETISIPSQCQKSTTPLVEVAKATKPEEKSAPVNSIEARKHVRSPTVHGFWVPNSDPYSGNDTAKAARTLGYHNAQAIAEAVLAGKREIGEMDCSGKITLRDGTVLRAQSMMYDRYRVDQRTPVHVSCNENTSHREAVYAYEARGEYYVVARACGNPVRAVVIYKPTPKEKKQRALTCQKIATAWAQGELRGEFVNASVRMGCLFDIGPRSQLGPVVGAQIGRYWGRENGWTEKSWFVGLGPEFRTKPGTDLLDSFEVFVLAGPGFTAGGNGEVMRHPSYGLDGHIGITMEKTVPIGRGTTMTIRFMPFGHKAFTNRYADLTWQGHNIGSEVARKDVAGAILRLEFDNVKWKLRPELTIGGWYVWDVIDHFGAKILVGFSTKDKVWRVGVGAQYAGGGWVPIAEIEYNPILGRMLLSAQVADDALTEGAKSSKDSLGVAPAAKAKPKIAKAKARAKVRGGSGNGSPFGFADPVYHTGHASSGGHHYASHVTSTHSPSGHVGSPVGPFGY